MRGFYPYLLAILILLCLCFVAFAQEEGSTPNDDLGIREQQFPKRSDLPKCSTVKELAKTLMSFEPVQLLGSKSIDGDEWFMSIDKDGLWMMGFAPRGDKDIGCVVAVGSKPDNLLGKSGH
jgi:hypothetical protein